MKKIIVSALFLFFAPLFLASCSYYGEKRDVCFVYAIGAGENDGQFEAYFLKSANENKENAQNSGENEKESVKDTETVYLECEKTSGKNADEAFRKFYEKYSDVYINSANIYVFSKNMGKETLSYFGKYLVNSNKLPLKRDVFLCEDVMGLFSLDAEKYDAKGFEKACAELGESENIVYFLAAETQNTDNFPKEACFSDGKMKIKGKET